jgi:tRNA pseudouridine55 synthase
MRVRSAALNLGTANQPIVETVNGLLVVDKPEGLTSHDVVSRLRRALNESSIGHLGTLDPMATGVLPMLLGKYTRLAQFFGEMQKSYTGIIRFGFSTDTYDAEGKPTSGTKTVNLSIDEIRRRASTFHGDIDQTPPQFSAKKTAGKPAYKSARAGQVVELKPVRIRIDRFEIRNFDADLAEFFIVVSSGGYVRAVAHELGESLGCGAHLAGLRRTQAGPFSIADAVPLGDAERLAREGNLAAYLRHPRELLPELPSVTADELSAGRLRNGMAVNLPEFSNSPLVKIFCGQHDLIGVGKRIAGTLFHPKVVLG